LTVEVEGDFHRTRSGIIAGIVGGIPSQGLKRTPEPILPDVANLAVLVVVGADARWIELVNHEYSLRPGGLDQVDEAQQSKEDSDKG
jgi:hypothetical protein